MAELMWEIRFQKRTLHQRVNFEPYEKPADVFQRVIQESKGTDKEIPERMMDPNTGQEVDIKWQYFYRYRGEEFPLQPYQPFEVQNIPPTAVIVIKAPSIRAQTIYIEGFEGLKEEELEAARSKAPWIAAIVFAILLIGGGSYYYFVHLPEVEKREPYRINVMTEPKESIVTLILDAKDVPYRRNKKQRFEFLNFTTPQKNVPIPKQAKLVYAEIKHKGYKTWTWGLPLDKFKKKEKEFKTLPAIELTKPGFFPDELEKLPPPPKFLAVPGPSPKPLAVKFPRRWRRLILGIDIADSTLKISGIDGTKGSTLSWNLSKALEKEFKAWRRYVRIRLSRRKPNDSTPPKRRARLLRYTNAIIQLAFIDGKTVFPNGNQKKKEGDKEIAYNDAVGGFQVIWSENNAKSAYSERWAKCMVNSLKKAGFKPFQVGDPSKSKDKKTLPPPDPKEYLKSKKSDNILLNGRQPALKIVLGSLSHRAELKAWKTPATYRALSTAIADSLICLRSKK